eukprot:6175-Hanusia_phi.AAC.6
MSIRSACLMTRLALVAPAALDRPSQGDLHNDNIPAEALHPAGRSDEELKHKLKRVVSAEPQLETHRSRGAGAGAGAWELDGQQKLAELESELRLSRRREAKLER